MPAPAAQARELLQRLQGLVLGRLILGVVAAGGAILGQGYDPGTLRIILSALGVSAALNALVFVVPLKPRALASLAHALLLADTALVTFLVYLTGWAGSPFLPLTFAAVVGAALLLGRAWAAIYASAMVLALCAVTGFYRAGALGHRPPPLLAQESPVLWQRDLAYYLGHLLLETGALYAVAALSGILVARLSREQVLIREILDLTRDGVLAVDARGRLLLANAEARRCLRLPALQPGDRLQPALEPEIGSWLLPAMESSAPMQTARTVETPAGPTLPLSVQVSPLAEGRARRGTVVLVTDLTREREAAAAERRAERLEATARLSMGIAHEIRNPLASIRGAAQEMGRSPDSRLTAMILRESDRLDRILGEFLSYARLAAPRPVRCDLGRLVEETLETARRRPEAKGVDLRARTEPGLLVPADPGQLAQLLLNLVINARQALGGKGTVSVAARREGGQAVLSVADDGPGVPGEARARIFEPFFTTKPEGTGLGLAMAARVASAHGGEIRLLSPERGAAFELWLPEGEPHA